ncbi:MAG: 50S ribosomal protein L23, partial [Candidatus Kerfeldbacteria bacterium]|nr:50S ribosomal protein L23 [Candidatus Kerfeldbacteria bacterium]
RRGRSTGVTSDWKKAIVTIKAGEKIEFYEGN